MASSTWPTMGAVQPREMARTGLTTLPNRGKTELLGEFDIHAPYSAVPHKLFRAL